MMLCWIVVGYLDPGTGSLFAQVAAASLIAAAATFTWFRKKLFSLFKRNKKEK